MEGLGKKLQDARIARNLTLEEAGRMTKVRPSRLEAIENEDFSQFDSLAYSKAFVLIYGKFLDVDVSPYLEAFETSEHVTVDGYAYLQDNPAPAPSRPVAVRRQSSSGRGSLLPFAIGVIVLVGGFVAMKAILDVQRLKPAKTGSGSSPAATMTPAKIVAPHAIPVESTPAPTPEESIAPTPQPTVAVVTPTPIPAPLASPSEPEVRRAEPVNAKDAPKYKPTATPTPTPRKVRSPSPRPSLSPRPTMSPRPSPR
jgi:cytoskeletal protein RodZ